MKNHITSMNNRIKEQCGKEAAEKYKENCKQYEIPEYKSSTD